MSRFVLVRALSAAAIVLLAGCGSSSKPVAPASSLDTSPPAIPDGLRQVYGHAIGITMLRWNPSPSPDAAKYEVYIYEPDPSRENSYVKAGECAADQPRWDFPAGLDNQTYTCRVRTVDGAGNASAFSVPFTVTVSAFPPADGGGGDPRRRIDM